MEPGRDGHQGHWRKVLWGWLERLNAFLSRAYEEADVATGC
jgi:hypothetical protein